MASAPTRERRAARRGGSCRPTRGVEEPYRLTPQTALRIAVLGAVVLGVFARPLLPALGAAGALRRQYLQRRPGEPGAHACALAAPRGAILDRNGRVLVTNVAGSRRRDLARRPAEAAAATHELRALSQDRPRARSHGMAARDRRRGRATARPGDREAGRPRGPGRVPLRAPGRVPGRRSIASTLRPQLPATRRSPRRCSATSARSRRSS